MTPKRASRSRAGRPRPTWRRRVRDTLLTVAVVAAALPVLGLVAFRWLPVPVTPLMLVRVVQGEGLRQTWLPLEEAPASLVRSVIASEDARFCSHTGFDWREIRNAWSAWQAGEGLRGASTITMQTARSVFLWPGRDPVRKAVEIALTPPLEWVWGKRRILEVYLNVAEWGPGVYGAEAAARHHFGRGAEDLTARQAAQLTAILPAPRRWSAAQPSAYVSRRAGTIQARARQVALGDRNAPCPQTR
ncbi:monofunctional biosynthetic peptidoglycan transglycosylase [uncultured Rhodospira sp.]|uniref:monofunctional biosynthetic peptidoglycan transglycosylase n=1 Tax=uncultured Rhodospira sp. TaxID=1936189 RepID=UPI0026215E6C|nr:monofunctional biosynthetic peptidoglycan transglycosylase [uncultured Rhodospira sp.]